MRIEVSVERDGGSHVAKVLVEQRGRRTEHLVTVRNEDLARYAAIDVADLVRRSFAFLLDREPNTSILREFRITEIERYFPGFRDTVRGPSR